MRLLIISLLISVLAGLGIGLASGVAELGLAAIVSFIIMDLYVIFVDKD